VVGHIDHEIHFDELFDSVFPVGEELVVSFLEVVLLASDEETGDVVIVFGANEALEVGVIFFNCRDFFLRQLLLQIMQFFSFLKMFPLD
jgi:hypothetical protein